MSWDLKMYKHGNPSPGKITQMKMTHLKFSINLEAVWKHPTHKWIHHEEVYSIEHQEEIVEQFDIRLINAFQNVATQETDKATEKENILFNTTKYFEIKWYIRKQPMTLTYQALLDKFKVYERSLVYYSKTQKASGTTIRDHTRTTVKCKTSKSHY